MDSLTASPLQATTLERRARRAALVEMRDRCGGRGKESAQALLLDWDAFDDWIAERGGDEGFLVWLTAQVSSGVTLKGLCANYARDYALLSAWMIDVNHPERLQQYRLAQQWLADAEVAETLGIADGSDADNVAVDKFRNETRFKRAKYYDPERYGEKDLSLGAGLQDLAAVLTKISERKQKDLGKAITQDVIDAEVIPAKPVLTVERVIERDYL